MTRNQLAAVLFEGYAADSCCEVDLDAEGAAWMEQHGSTGEYPSAMLDPLRCQQMVDDFHKRRKVNWSYGGYLENRARIWKGSYLEKRKNYIHLGVDFNVPTGTKVVAPFDGKVITVDEDGDLQGGWGPRVIVRPIKEGPLPFVFIFAHLAEVKVQPGDSIKAHAELARVGAAPLNGNWYPHLHLQTVTIETFEKFQRECFGELDGYGLGGELDSITREYPEPLAALERCFR